MKKVVLPLVLAGLAACSQTKEAEKAPLNAIDFASVIDSSYLHKHLSVIAHDSLQGRDTGSEGQRKAGEYIIKEYKRLGIVSGIEDGSYLQPVEFNTSKLNSVTYSVNQMVKPAKGEALHLTTTLSADSESDIVKVFGSDVSFNAEVIFAGFGITDAKRGVTPFEGVDVKDKWVLAFLEHPTVENGDTLISPDLNNNSRYREIAMTLGAKGLILIAASDASYDRNLSSAKAKIGKHGGLQLAYLAKEGNSGGFSYNLIRPTLASKILGLADTTALKAKYTELVGSVKTFRASSTNFEIEINSEVIPEKVMSNNIVGFIEGSDPVAKHEFVVLSAHYDHVGVGAPDSTGDTIYNGADDDGSGTVGLLGVGEAMMAAKKAGVGPKRSVILLHVTAEEKGLLGSRFYSDHPIYPIDKTIANVNVDMIGRIDDDYTKTNDGNYIYIIGGSIISSAMDSILQVANSKTVKINLDMKFNDLNDVNQFYRRSDHWNFGRLGVPFAFFFNGVHPEYHRPGDEVDKIAFDAMTKRTKLIFAYTLELANMSGRPKVDNQEFINKTKSNAR